MPDQAELLFSETSLSGLDLLRQKIAQRNARLAVIGLGYVGLAVACEFAHLGFNVLGVELRPERVAKINLGSLPFGENEPGLAELLAEVVFRQNLHATVDYAALAGCDIILIAVETPVDEYKCPQYQALRSAISNLGPHLKPGALVIVESTTAPGTLQHIVLPLLQKASGLELNRDFFLGNCPERVMPGRLLANLRQVSRVVGGITPETAETMAALYRQVVSADLDLTDCLTAELVKTTENAYRDVQIAFANEVALICEQTGGDVWKVRSLVNKSPHRQMHLPGAGVGGHCIPKDPWLLAHSLVLSDNSGAREEISPLKIIPAARQVNDDMPSHMIDLLEDACAEAGISIQDACILVMGFAYLEDSDDPRNSPSQALVDRLHDLGAETIIHDPYISPYHQDLFEYAQNCDAAVIMVRHRPYLELDLGRLKSALRRPILIDGRNAYDPGLFISSLSEPDPPDWIFRSLGRAKSSRQDGLLPPNLPPPDKP